MLAELFAVIFVALTVLGPGSYLLHVAWKNGGAARKLAIATLAAALLLIAWLVSPRDSGTTVQERISDFIGAWGMLSMIVGGGVIGAVALRQFCLRCRSDKED